MSTVRKMSPPSGNAFDRVALEYVKLQARCDAAESEVRRLEFENEQLRLRLREVETIPPPPAEPATRPEFQVARVEESGTWTK